MLKCLQCEYGNIVVNEAIGQYWCMDCRSIVSVQKSDGTQIILSDMDNGTRGQMVMDNGAINPCNKVSNDL